MTRLVVELGAVPLHLTAIEHDQAVAAISHLPQVLASALVNRVARTPSSLDLAAGGFRDLTRIALSANTWWPEVLIENREALADLLRSSEHRPVFVGRYGRSGRGGTDQRGACSRPGLPVARSKPRWPASGWCSRTEPGEIARVGHALEVSKVDLRDLQLRHATHGGGGVLTLSVRASELDLLTDTLPSRRVHPDLTSALSAYLSGLNRLRDYAEIPVNGNHLSKSCVRPRMQTRLLLVLAVC